MKWRKIAARCSLQKGHSRASAGAPGLHALGLWSSELYEDAPVLL